MMVLYTVKRETNPVFVTVSTFPKLFYLSLQKLQLTFNCAGFYIDNSWFMAPCVSVRVIQLTFISFASS